MTTFQASTTAQAVVPVERERIWQALTDPALVARFTPFIKEIKERDGHWIWTMSGLEVLGKGFTATFTEKMTLDEEPASSSATTRPPVRPSGPRSTASTRSRTSTVAPTSRPASRCASRCPCRGSRGSGAHDHEGCDGADGRPVLEEPAGPLRRLIVLARRPWGRRVVCLRAVHGPWSGTRPARPLRLLRLAAAPVGSCASQRPWGRRQAHDPVPATTGRTTGRTPGRTPGRRGLLARNQAAAPQ